MVNEDGSIACWGNNYGGALGVATPLTSPLPVVVPVTGMFTQVIAADGYAAALRSDGTVWCWGDNSNGACGLGPNGIEGTPPTQVIAGVAQFSTAEYRGCAVKTDGSV